MLGALRGRGTVREFGGGRRRFAAPGRVDAFVGGRDGAQQQGAQVLHQRVEKLFRGAVEGEGPPALQRVPGEDGARLQAAPHARVLVVVGAVDGGGEPQRGGVLGGGGPGQLGHPGLERVQDAVCRTGHGVVPGVEFLGPVDEPGAQRRHGAGRQQPAAPGRLGQFGNGEAGDVAEPGLGEQRPVLPRHLGHHLVGHPVEHGDQGGVVLLGGAQQVPGHRVGVPGGRGDHHPDVGGADQFGRQDAVVGEEGVDVGRVEKGDAGRQAVGGLDPQDARGVLAGQQQVVVRVPVGHPHAREVGQHPHAAEPVVVLRVAHQDRCAGRGPQYARLADPAPHEGVHQGGLAGAGGPAHHGQQRRFGFLEPRHEVVVELGEQFVAVGTRAWRSGQRQREACGRDTVAQGGKCVEKLRPYVQGHHMRRMPNFEGILKHMSMMSMSARRPDTPD